MFYIVLDIFSHEEKLQVLKFNGTRIRNIHHLAHLVDCKLKHFLSITFRCLFYKHCVQIFLGLSSACKNKYLCFEFEDNYIAVLEREEATAASSCILKDYGIPSERSSDLLKPYVDPLGDDQPLDHDLSATPVSNFEIDFDGLLWA